MKGSEMLSSTNITVAKNLYPVADEAIRTVIVRERRSNADMRAPKLGTIKLNRGRFQNKTVISKETETENSATGIKTKISAIIKKSSPAPSDWSKLHNESMFFICSDILKDSDRRLFFMSMSLMEYGNLIVLDKRGRRNISRLCGLCESSIEKSIKVLLRYNILIPLNEEIIDALIAYGSRSVSRKDLEGPQNKFIVSFAFAEKDSRAKIVDIVRASKYEKIYDMEIEVPDKHAKRNATRAAKLAERKAKQGNETAIKVHIKDETLNLDQNDETQTEAIMELRTRTDKDGAKYVRKSLKTYPADFKDAKVELAAPLKKCSIDEYEKIEGNDLLTYARIMEYSPKDKRINYYVEKEYGNMKNSIVKWLVHANYFTDQAITSTDIKQRATYLSVAIASLCKAYKNGFKGKQYAKLADLHNELLIRYSKDIDEEILTKSQRMIRELEKVTDNNPYNRVLVADLDLKERIERVVQ